MKSKMVAIFFTIRVVVECMVLETQKTKSPWSGTLRSACPELLSSQKHSSTLKGRHVVFPPWQRSCILLQSLHRVFAKYWAEVAGVSSLQSTPGSMRLRYVPLHEEQAKREMVFQRRGPSKGMGWQLCLDPWGNVEELVRRLFSKDAEVHWVWWKIFWKIMKIKGTFVKSNKSSYQIWNLLITVALPSKHATIFSTCTLTMILTANFTWLF
jgi:hypothetical protein